jgi:hypothetical protein
VIIGAAAAPFAPPPLRRAITLSSANSTCSDDWGSVIRSSAPASKAASMKPFGLPA